MGAALVFYQSCSQLLCCPRGKTILLKMSTVRLPVITCAVSRWGDACSSVSTNRNGHLRGVSCVWRKLHGNHSQWRQLSALEVSISIAMLMKGWISDWFTPSVFCLKSFLFFLLICVVFHASHYLRQFMFFRSPSTHLINHEFIDRFLSHHQYNLSFLLLTVGLVILTYIIRVCFSIRFVLKQEVILYSSHVCLLKGKSWTGYGEWVISCCVCRVKIVQALTEPTRHN